MFSRIKKRTRGNPRWFGMLRGEILGGIWKTLGEFWEAICIYKKSRSTEKSKPYVQCTLLVEPTPLSCWVRLVQGRVFALSWHCCLEDGAYRTLFYKLTSNLDFIRGETLKVHAETRSTRVERSLQHTCVFFSATPFGHHRFRSIRLVVFFRILSFGDIRNRKTWIWCGLKKQSWTEPGISLRNRDPVPKHAPIATGDAKAVLIRLLQTCDWLAQPETAMNYTSLALARTYRLVYFVQDLSFGMPRAQNFALKRALSNIV